MHARLIGCLLLITIAAKAQRSDDIVSYINAYRDIAIAEEQRTGVPAAITLAQGIHETQAGKSELVRKSNNHFGIKCKSSWTGDRVYHDDDARGECFRSYGHPEESYRDHSDFLRSSPRYGFLFQLDPQDYKAWASGLRQAGYATNYRYAQILIKLIEDYDLQQYTLVAMGKRPMPEQTAIAVAANAGNPEMGTSSVVIQSLPAVNDVKARVRPPHPEYPPGEFRINDTRVVFAKAGTALLAVAEESRISFARLLDFNDLNDGDVLKDDQLLFLQRKRKSGANAIHVVQPGETLYDICQAEGMRLESLLAYNFLTEKMQPAEGEKLYCQAAAPARPLLAEEKRTVLREVNVVVKAVDTTHVVQTKETLYSISKKYGVSTEQLKSWNKLDSADLRIGQQLLIRSAQ